MRRYGINTVRDGVRWHLVESHRGCYEWSSWLSMVRAANAAGLQVIWDLCHYGWPDHLDIWAPHFVDAFARFAAAAARLLKNEGSGVLQICPINEISFLAWAGGECGRMNPGATGRGSELKAQLVRAFIAAVHAIREVDPDARIMTSEPLIHVIGGSANQEEVQRAESYRLAQFETVNMLLGLTSPALGGHVRCVDVLGLNFYPDNQWYYGGSTIPLGHHAYRPLSEMLLEVDARYRLPMMISETGAEGSARTCWLRYVCTEVRRASSASVCPEAICIYPILDYPGWDNERLCQAGLLSLPYEGWNRRVDEDMLQELTVQISAFAAFGAAGQFSSRGQAPDSIVSRSSRPGHDGPSTVDDAPHRVR